MSFAHEHHHPTGDRHRQGEHALPEGLSYAELLEMLRHDLLLNVGHDVLHADDGARNNLGLARGTVTLAFAASTNSNLITVKHGLLRVPALVLAGSLAAPAFGQIPLCSTYNYTLTTFQLNAELKTAYTGNITVVWFAIE